MAVRAKKPKVTKAKSKKFTNLIIIDASGSMAPKLQEVIGGIKQIFKSIKEDATKNPEVESTTIVLDFSSAKDFNVLVNSTNPDDLKGKVAESYFTRGMTALYDAIGHGFSLVPKDQDGVFINILTDGEENDSKELRSEDVKKLIDDAKSKKWAITFMGTSEACLNSAESLGISRGNMMQFVDTGAGTLKALNTTQLSRNVYYSTMISTKDFDLSSKSIDLENIVSNVLSNDSE